MQRGDIEPPEITTTSASSSDCDEGNEEQLFTEKIWNACTDTVAGILIVLTI